VWTASASGPGPVPALGGVLDAPFVDAVGASVASPDGHHVYVTGPMHGLGAGAWRFTTVAYRADTGQTEWIAVYDSPGAEIDLSDIPQAIAVSPDGRNVYVTGAGALDGEPGSEAVTVAYDAATGRQRWVDRYAGTWEGADEGTAVEVAPDGRTVLVLTDMRKDESGSMSAIGLRALDPATGRRRWGVKYDGDAGEGLHLGVDLQVSADGRTAFATGITTAFASGWDYGTLAFDLRDGRRLWVRRYHGGQGVDIPMELGLARGGSLVVVTGQSESAVGDAAATVAYDARTGRQRWVYRTSGTAGRGAEAAALAVSPDGRTVAVGSTETGFDSGGDWNVTVIFADSGRAASVGTYDGPGSDEDILTDVGYEGFTVYSAGFTADPGGIHRLTTAAWDGEGDIEWLGRLDDAGRSSLDLDAVLVATKQKVVVSGNVSSAAPPTGFDLVTVAYDR
jgi:outer membrane protein assembly factor BamB